MQETADAPLITEKNAFWGHGMLECMTGHRQDPVRSSLTAKGLSILTAIFRQHRVAALPHVPAQAWGSRYTLWHRRHNRLTGRPD